MIHENDSIHILTCLGRGCSVPARSSCEEFTGASGSGPCIRSGTRPHGSTSEILCTADHRSTLSETEMQMQEPHTTRDNITLQQKAVALHQPLPAKITECFRFGVMTWHPNFSLYRCFTYNKDHLELVHLCVWRHGSLILQGPVVV